MIEGSPDAAEGSITCFFSEVRNGNEAALAPLWQRYFPRLMALAGRVLARRPGAVADAEDAVQDALVSFWRRTRAGEFANVMDRNHLWQLLAQFTVYKAHRHLRQAAAARRGGSQTLDEAALTIPLDQLGAIDASDIDLLAAELVEQLPPELRELAVLRLLGHTTTEIADQQQWTQRKVQRKLELVRLHWEKHQSMQ